MPEATNRDCGTERGRKHLEEEEKQAHSLWEGWQWSLEDLLSFFKDNIIWLSFNYLPIFSPESSWYYPSQSNSMLCFVLDRILAILFFIMNNLVYRGILMGDYWERGHCFEMWSLGSFLFLFCLILTFLSTFLPTSSLSFSPIPPFPSLLHPFIPFKFQNKIVNMKLGELQH